MSHDAKPKDKLRPLFIPKEYHLAHLRRLMKPPEEWLTLPWEEAVTSIERRLIVLDRETLLSYIED